MNTAIKLHDDYLKLFKRFPLVPIKTKARHKLATALIMELSNRLNSLNSGELDYFDVLSDLIIKYERTQLDRVIEPASGVEALQYLIEEHGLSQGGLARATGLKRPHITAYLNGSRDLSKAYAKTLANYFKVSVDLFL